MRSRTHKGGADYIPSTASGKDYLRVVEIKRLYPKIQKELRQCAVKMADTSQHSADWKVLNHRREKLELRLRRLGEEAKNAWE